MDQCDTLPTSRETIEHTLRIDVYTANVLEACCLLLCMLLLALLNVLVPNWFFRASVPKVEDGHAQYT